MSFKEQQSRKKSAREKTRRAQQRASLCKDCGFRVWYPICRDKNTNRTNWHVHLDSATHKTNICRNSMWETSCLLCLGKIFECPADWRDHLNSRNYADSAVRRARQVHTEWAACEKAGRRNSYWKSNEALARTRVGNQCNGRPRGRGATAGHGDVEVLYQARSRSRCYSCDLDKERQGRWGLYENSTRRNHTWTYDKGGMTGHQPSTQQTYRFVTLI